MIYPRMILLSWTWMLVLISSSWAASRVFVSRPDSKALIAPNKILACYYSPVFMNETHIPPHLCTHIIYSAVPLSTTGVMPRPTDIVSWRLLNKLKQKNPTLKLMISICDLDIVVGKGYQVMESFVNGTNEVLRKYDLDGLDLDWEFPGFFRRNGFLELQKALYAMLKPQGKLLTAAAPHDLWVFVISYYTEAVNKFFDFMTVMTYDYHVYQPSHPYTGYNSPLKPAAEAINQIMHIAGVEPSKLLLGYATYARSWKLADSKNHELGAKAVGVGRSDPYLNATGYFSLAGICDEVRKGGKIVEDPINGAEYMYHGNVWVSFNGLYSAQIEAEWIRTSGIGGVGYWNLEYGDYRNVCGYGAFPVFNRIKKILEQPQKTKT